MGVGSVAAPAGAGRADAAARGFGVAVAPALVARGFGAGVAATVFRAGALAVPALAFGVGLAVAAWPGFVPRAPGFAGLAVAERGAAAVADRALAFGVEAVPAGALAALGAACVVGRAPAFGVAALVAVAFGAVAFAACAPRFGVVAAVKSAFGLAAFASPAPDFAAGPVAARAPRFATAAGGAFGVLALAASFGFAGVVPEGFVASRRAGAFVLPAAAGRVGVRAMAAYSWRGVLGHMAPRAQCMARRRARGQRQPPRAARIALAEAACSRAGTRHQPPASASRGGACRRARRRRAAWPASARRVQPGRGSTATGVLATSRSHPRQRGSCTRLSAPSTSTKRTRGKRRASRARVRTV